MESITGFTPSITPYPDVDDTRRTLLASTQAILGEHFREPTASAGGLDRLRAALL